MPMSSSGTSASQSANGRQRLRPDRELIRRVLASGGEDLRKCMQCGTCSSVCEVLDGDAPGPRTQMLCAQWGLGERLMSDPNLWLCHQCGDCTRRCPRGARPSDVLAALRRECILHHAWPGLLGRWAARPAAWLWTPVAMIALLLGASALWQASGAARAELALGGPRAVFPFWARLPHGLLGGTFAALVAFDLIVLFRGAKRFWRSMSAAHGKGVHDTRLLGASIRAAASRIVFHDDFASCSASQVRRTHHLLVVFGFSALWLTSLWAMTARWNPLLAGLVYPLGFFDPWKLMANLGGLSLAAGSSLMVWERWRRPGTAGATSRWDLTLLVSLLAIAVSGFASEVLHWLRVEPLRYAVYTVHLALVLTVLLLLPYSKLAHVVYRTLAIAYAERIGRRAFRRRQSQTEAEP
jgi:quinone-modifying oxidoreductase subunit QmoC